MHAIDMANGQSMLDQRSSRDLNDDSTIARALQMLEFEMIQDIIRPGADTDFNEKEFRASTLKRQLFTLSTIVGLTQVSPPPPPPFLEPTASRQHILRCVGGGVDCDDRSAWDSALATEPLHWTLCSNHGKILRSLRNKTSCPSYTSPHHSSFLKSLYHVLCSLS